MKLWNTLITLGLQELTHDEYLDGFDKTILFVFPKNIASFMQNHLSTQELPELAILRNGVVKNSGKMYARKERNTPIPYSLLYLDRVNQRLKTVKDETGKSVSWILWNKEHYILIQWEIYTAKKYVEWWKWHQENLNRIILEQL